MEIKGKNVQLEVSSPNDVELKVNDVATIIRQPVWGDIEGDISNQIDLQEEFALYREKDEQDIIDEELKSKIKTNETNISELQGYLSDESERAINAENQLATNLTNEIERATGAEKSLLDNVTVNAKAIADLISKNFLQFVKILDSSNITVTDKGKSEDGIQTFSLEVTGKAPPELTDNLEFFNNNSQQWIVSNLILELDEKANSIKLYNYSFANGEVVEKTTEVLLSTDEFKIVDSKLALAKEYLTTSDASNTYLKKTDAQLTYASKSELMTEATNRSKEDTNLQSQIDAINSRSDVVDVVATKADLDAYAKDITIDDIIKVLQDESQDNATTYYRNTAESKPYVWELIGKVGPYYTQAETNTLINNETTSRENADKTLQSSIDDEVSRAQGVEASLQDKISAETERAENVESGKQDTLVSGTNIKTINNESILGSGNIEVKGGVTSVTATNGLTGGTITSEGTIGLETKTVSTNSSWLEIDEYGRVVDSLENYKQYYDSKYETYTTSRIVRTRFFNYTTDPTEDDIADMYSFAKNAGTIFSIANVYDSDNNLSKVNIYAQANLFWSTTTFNKVSSFSEIVSTMSEEMQLYIYDKLGLYIAADGSMWYVFYHEPSFDDMLATIDPTYIKVPKGCTTIYQYDISDIDLVEENVALLYDSTNSKMYKYKNRKDRQEYTFGGTISDISKVTAGNFTYYRYMSQINSGGGKYINYTCYLFSDGQADVGYDIYSVVPKTISTKLSNLTNGQSIATGTDIDTIVNNGFYHQVGDWSGTLPSVDGIEWHYSNLLAFNAGVDVTVQMLFPFNSSTCYAYRTGRGNPLTWQSWSVVSPNTYATTTYVNEQIGTVINANY